jgi:hypothetical protein
MSARSALVSTLLLTAVHSSAAQACWTCRAEVHSRVYSDGFVLQLATLSLPVVIVTLVAVATYRLGRVGVQRSRERQP